jgi:hypothetical protein
VVIGVPAPETLEESAKEWGRVVKTGGRLTVITPSILVQKHTEPMTIGDYVEKYEHQVIEKGSLIDHEVFTSKLKDNFANLIESEAIHMTFISADGV